MQSYNFISLDGYQGKHITTKNMEIDIVNGIITIQNDILRKQYLYYTLSEAKKMFKQELKQTKIV